MESLQNIFQQLYGRWAKEPKDQTYYVKITFAIISAVICGLAGPVFAGLRGLMFGIFLYILSLFVIVYLLEVEPETMGGQQKLITNSLPSYLLLWVLLWTLIFAFTLPESILGNLP
jgi:hypothetical protein